MEYSSHFFSPDGRHLSHCAGEANLIVKIANGIADDMLSMTIMATRAPVVIAPAMNENMWLNPIVQGNLEKLKKLGYQFVGPEYGPMACGGEGWGKLARVESIIAKLIEISEEIDKRLIRRRNKEKKLREENNK